MEAVNAVAHGVVLTTLLSWPARRLRLIAIDFRFRSRTVRWLNLDGRPAKPVHKLLGKETRLLNAEWVV